MLSAIIEGQMVNSLQFKRQLASRRIGRAQKSTRTCSCDSCMFAKFACSTITGLAKLLLPMNAYNAYVKISGISGMEDWVEMWAGCLPDPSSSGHSRLRWESWRKLQELWDVQFSKPWKMQLSFEFLTISYIFKYVYSYGASSILKKNSCKTLERLQIWQVTGGRSGGN